LKMVRDPVSQVAVRIQLSPVKALGLVIVGVDLCIPVAGSAAQGVTNKVLKTIATRPRW